MVEDRELKAEEKPPALRLIKSGARELGSVYLKHTEQTLGYAEEHPLNTRLGRAGCRIGQQLVRKALGMIERPTTLDECAILYNLGLQHLNEHSGQEGQQKPMGLPSANFNALELELVNIHNSHLVCLTWYSEYHEDKYTITGTDEKLLLCQHIKHILEVSPSGGRKITHRQTYGSHPSLGIVNPKTINTRYSPLEHEELAQLIYELENPIE